MLSLRKGIETRALTIDHRPSECSEKNRIISNGGKIYQNPIIKSPIAGFYEGIEGTAMGPLRVLPGGLSVYM